MTEQLFAFDFETAACRRCHVTEQDLLTRDEAGHWHNSHQRSCRPPQHRPGTTVLPFPARRGE
jgi:hypothetical protein